MEPERASERCESILDAVSEAVIADRETLRLVLMGTLTRGHVLLEDVPGTGKTLTARSLATALGLSFSRVQFTPDLLPADVLGTEVYDEDAGEFRFRNGPVFANVVLADEINRASPKTQAALLEAMEERQVTVDGETHPLPDPFFVIATQNPIDEGQGTFPLPEAQKDRFLVKTALGYPDPEGEEELLARRASRTDRAPTTDTVLSEGEMGRLQAAVEGVEVHQNLLGYLVDIVTETREDARTSVGVSPRGTQRLFELVRARALIAGREFATPDDVKAVAVPALAHRVVLTADARVNEATGEDVVRDALSSVSVPTVRRVARQ